ncbi:GtrA family protein [Microbulbifer sp. 2304DJ12-6]|uniref:GtrA family protein n=1 Tax=Microbulbifer sp. 2304DJ12-6 TaxID=3233340 RepID=UPI002631CF47|nr:GtrA family protein [uncultured Microbulbifer sp.]
MYGDSEFSRFRVTFVGFLAAGGLATTVHWAVMALFVGLTSLPVFSTLIGSASGAIVNYWLQHRLAFPGAEMYARTFFRYLASCAFAWIVNVSVFFVLTRDVHFPIIIAQVVTTALVAGLNFIVYKRLVFHEKTP